MYGHCGTLLSLLPSGRPQGHYVVRAVGNQKNPRLIEPGETHPERRGAISVVSRQKGVPAAGAASGGTGNQNRGPTLWAGIHGISMAGMTSTAVVRNPDILWQMTKSLIENYLAGFLHRP
jgi:hypothetical protein